MNTSNLISNTLEFEGTKIKFTWYPGDDISKYEPFTQIYGVVFDQNGNMLIQRREGCDWCLAGGTVESGETAEETLRRELIEEADVTVKNPILLGGQRVQFPGGHNPNPSKRGDDDFYQLRYYCEVDEVLPQTPDPDHDVINERLFVPQTEINKYLGWGITGQAIFDQAIALFHHLHP
ncbi:MAG: MutT/nudix family protein [Candidatus Collierbacteria bacterium GW2011_GWC2_44_18]|uniref:MutT/nudix family protein n=2 Tax=Microgenomates group TaxID=1794810 RepID=A0A0G1LCC4_9BACT|nr:MAG: MutT/nudix family protein [Candidatus Collierbacteria bacterium GW2011_GWC2_44_18]KKT66347.1 MAG: MutT/nudix family protein [Candidatus Woesebacteria bacterium GW2011_GWA2_44_33]